MPETATLPRHAPARDGGPDYDVIELLFFAYRDFVADPDRLLGRYGFGRAHHRVLHFVARRPGLPIADLLDLLKITKQSLNRVLKDLVEGGFVESRTGAADRRQRLLFATPVGASLARDLAGVQTRRIARALSQDDGTRRSHVARFLAAMIEPDDLARMRPAASRATMEP